MTEAVSGRELGVEDAVHPIPGEAAQQATQLLLHAVEIGVVAEPALPRRVALARLLGIDLPGMEVEEARLAVAPVHPADAGLREGVGEEAEIAAAAAREVAAGDHRG